MINAMNEHFNLIPAWEQSLDFAAKHGMKVMLEHGCLTPETIHSSTKLKELDGLIDRLRDHPALEAYYLVDEPKVSAFSDLEKMVAHLREKDPKHLAFINLLPLIPTIQKTGTEDAVSAYRKYVRAYLKIVKPDLLSYDYYHFFKDKTGKAFDDTSYFQNLSVIRDASLEFNVPFLNIIQCSEFLNYWRLPSEGELRWLVNTTLAYGGRGISYFLYWGPEKYKGLYRNGKPIPLVTSVAKLNEEIALLSPVLMRLKSVGVYHSAPLPLGTNALPILFPIKFKSPEPFVLGAFEDSRQATKYALLVNRDYSKSHIFEILCPTKLWEYDEVVAKWIELNKHGSMSVKLQPGASILLKYD